MSTVKENFNQISPSEFFYRNRDLAGFSNPTRSLYTAVREFVENALDACDQQSILPNVHLSIKAVEPEKQDPKMYILSVKDNGPGIESKYIPKAFGTVLYGSNQNRQEEYLVLEQPWQSEKQAGHFKTRFKACIKKGLEGDYYNPGVKMFL